MKTVLKMVLMTLAALAGLTAVAADSVCATVKIEIRQELALERQAFEARMRINNGLTGINLTDVAVILSFEDADGQTMAFTFIQAKQHVIGC